MARGGVVAQRIQNEHVEILQKREANVWNVAHVRDVGGVAEAIAGDLLPSVGYGDSAKACAEEIDSGSRSGVDAMDENAGAGGVAVFLAKGVFEDAFDVACGCVVGVDRQ